MWPPACLPDMWPSLAVPTLVVSVLAACGPLPRPFQPGPEVDAGGLAAIGPDSLGVRVEPVAGPPSPMARRLAESVARELGRLGIPATTRSGTASHYSLSGWAQRDESGGESSTTVFIHWLLRDREANTIGSRTQGVSTSLWSWNFGDPEVIQMASAEAARLVAPMIRSVEVEVAAPEEPPSVWVEVVTGAPGDGDAALARAMRAALRLTGIPLALRTSEAQYRVGGTVVVEPVGTGMERVGIVWLVTAADGRPLGSCQAGKRGRTWGSRRALGTGGGVRGRGRRRRHPGDHRAVRRQRRDLRRGPGIRAGTAGGGGGAGRTTRRRVEAVASAPAARVGLEGAADIPPSPDRIAGKSQCGESGMW